MPCKDQQKFLPKTYVYNEGQTVQRSRDIKEK